MYNVNTGKRVLLLLSLVVLLAGQASAYTGPYRLMVFTDKQVYLDYGYSFDTLAVDTTDQNASKEGTFNQRPNVFAALLDSDGNIVRGLSSSNFSATLKDVQRWNHSGPALDNYPFYQVISTNGIYYNSLPFPAFTDADGDGIFNSTLDVVDLIQLPARPPVTDQVNISINVTMNYQGTNYRSNISVIFGVAGCHHPTNAITSAHAKTNHDNVVCTACHWGYQYALGVHGFNNSIMYSDIARYTGPDTKVTAGYDYKLGYVKTGGNATTWDNSNASFCVMCHGGPVNRNILDLGVGSTPTSTDQNADGLPDNNRPSCSWYQGPLGNNSAYTVCHAPQQGYDGSTKITWSSLNGTDWKGWSQMPGGSRSHNHSVQPRTNGTPCELCHAGGGAPGTGTGGMHMVAGLPNRSTDYTNINEQCWGCHNTTDGWLNITSNGGTAKNHSKTNQCSRCHVDNNKLNSHVIPVGAYGGRWCLDCHNLTGKAPIDMKVDPAIANISNANYTHYRLNENSSAANSSRICWGCHTNNSAIAGGKVEPASLPDSEHIGGYDAPRNCTSCHNNSNASLTFGAPQTYRHTWYAPDMRTLAVRYCPDCHGQDEMINMWDESVYPPKTVNESSAHYGRNRTTSFPPIGSREYCGYCHQNESTVMGPFAKPDNEVRSDHASQITTPGCGNSTCHRAGRMHDDTLVVPNFTEANISTTCLACHSQSNYNFHNSTLTCWDCHMGNSTNATWIHPIQFIQYNGNFTGAKLTAATCYDCHKSTSVDSVVKYVSGRTPPKVYNQAHSNDPNNGTKWGDYWKYTPTTYEFADYYVGSGNINPVYPFENIKVPSNDYMELVENRTGSMNGPATFPYTKAERHIEGPPVPNWTASAQVTSGTTTMSPSQDASFGNPAGSLKAMLKTRSATGTGTVTWNYSFYYNPDTKQYAYTNISVEYSVVLPSGSTNIETVNLRIVKPSGTVVTLATASTSTNMTWAVLSNNSFASVLDENGSAAPYKIQLHTELAGSGSKTVQNPYTVYYDNILLKFQEKVWNSYEIVINTTGVPVAGKSKLGMSYQAHMENTSLLIYNRTSQSYELLDTLDKGVFFDYVREINSTHHINSSDGKTGNVSVMFVDTDRSDRDAITDKFHIRYLYVFTDRGLQYPCEQCHSPNKHYINPSIGSPDKFKGSNRYNSTDMQNSTWCQQCHYQGASNYSDMIREFNVTRNPPENIPPEITGNATYAPKTRPGYVNHTGGQFSSMNDSACFQCHGKPGDTTTSQFVHDVQVAQGGNRRCITCHNTSALNTQFKKVDVDAMRRGMHANLKNASANVSNASDPIELACWACHGDGTYNESEMHHPVLQTCDRCHTNATAGRLKYSAPVVFEHIPPNLTAPEADIRTGFNGSGWTCADCHNNSINTTALTNDYDTVSARAGHYGLNRTGGKLMYNYTIPPKGNSEDCTYCHKGSSANMTKWGINATSTKNLSNKPSHSGFTNNDCPGCHGYSVNASFTFHVAEMNAGAGGGPDCISCHNTGAAGAPGNLWINASVMKQGAHKYLNRNATNSSSVSGDNKKCWACHGNGEESSGHHTSLYACQDCHNRTDNLTFITNVTIKNDLGRKKVAEHTPYYPENISSTRKSAAVNCTFCHNQSLPAFTDTASINENSNVSHYADSSALISPTANCTLCHKNQANASRNMANITRHPARTQEVSYCRYCHNTTNAAGLHSQNLDFRFGGTASIHGGSAGVNYWGFDWEEDDWNESMGLAPREEEGCNACHYDNGNFPAYANKCENCHLPDGNSLFTGPRNRNSGMMKYNASINDSIPRVYSHTNFSTVNVPNQSTPFQGETVYSSCYGIGKSCHGVDYNNRSSAGGYFAFNYMAAVASAKSDPYHFTNTLDRLPPTTDCLFCHNQTDAGARAAWGNAYQVNASNMYGATANQDCYNCHTTDKSAPKDFHASTLIPSVKGNPNCISCHNTGGNYSNVDFQALAGSVHGGVNGQASSSPANASNRPCWGCHGTVNASSGLANESDQPLNDHNLTYKTSPRKCPDCHITNNTLFGAKNVTDHIPSGYPVTDVNTSSYNNTYCSYCHNNSVNYANDEAMGLSTSTSPMNASVSHYGANRTAGKLMSALNNSTDCLYCHRNSSNMAKWGIIPGSPANISNKNATGGGTDHAPYASPDDCSQCHGGYTVISGFTFHNAALGNGSGGAGGKDCKLCHDIGKSAVGKLVNFSSMNATDAIHRNLNSGAAATVDAGNKKCWACHGDGTEPSAHPLNYKNPYTCTDCHTATGSQSGKYPGWNVTEHVKAGVASGTELFTPQAGSCYACHNRSEMMLYANDPDGGTGAVYGGANGGNNSTSHYGSKRSLGTGDVYCNYCHSNSSSIFYLSDQNRTIFEHTANASADVKNTSLVCSSCHGTGRIHNDTLARPSVQVWTVGKQDYCSPCHRAGNPGATRYTYGHNTSNITVISTDCGYCHNASSQGQTGGMLRVHSSTLTNRSTANATCLSCHSDAGYVSAPRVINTHYPGAPAGKANTSQDSFSCEACHGGMQQDKMHSPVIIPQDRCNNCHNGTVPGSFKATRIPYVNSTKHDNASHNVSNNINCEWCHNNTNAVQRFHFTRYPNGTVQAPGWAGWSNGTNANCTDCHGKYNQTAPFFAEPVWHKGNYGTTADNCYQCHTGASSSTVGSAPPALHNVTKAIDWSYCNNCHSNNYGGAPIVDNASLAGSMHSTLNGAGPSSTEPACKACHGGNATVHKNATVNNCTYCHITGSVKYSAKNVSRHVPYPYTADVNTSRYQKVFCSDCHNNSLRAFSDPTVPNRNASTAHYGMNRSAGKLMYDSTGNSEDCLYCHRTDSNMAAWGILSTGNANISRKGGTHATAANQDCYICHVNSTAAPVTFHMEELNGGVGGGPDCKACHNIGGSAAGRLVDFAAMNATGAIHRNLNSGATALVDAENKKCWACHTANGTAPQAGNHSFVDRYKNPYNCTDCHIAKAGQNLNFTPKAVLNVTQHKADAVNGTTIFTPAASDCYSCHSTGEMMVETYDPDNGTGAVYGGLHGGNGSTSHYGKVRDLGAGDAYCSYCHSNSSSIFPFMKDHNKSIIEHTTNTSANIRNSTTLECADCHRTGRIHDASINKTPQKNWTSGQRDFCAPCHKPKPTGQANKSVYPQAHDPANSSTDRIGDCGFCHNASSQGINGSYLNVHSETLRNGSTAQNSSTCQGCHNGTSLYVGAGKQILSHLPGAFAYRGNTSTSNYTCQSCHNMTDKPSMHSAGLNRSNGTCDSCHLNNTSPFRASKKNITQLAGMLNHSYNGTGYATCRMCHNASGAAVGFHFDQYAAGIIGDPERVNGVWADKGSFGFADSSPYVDCVDCHGVHNDTYPFNAPYFEANKTGQNAKNHSLTDSINLCYNCHTDKPDAALRYMVHNITIEPLEGGPACIKCHNLSAPSGPGLPSNYTRINHTALNNSVHRNLTNYTAWNSSKRSNTVLLDSACWTCHATDIAEIPNNAHPDRGGPAALSSGRPFQCEECHTEGGNVSIYNPPVYQNATKISRHYAGSVFMGTVAFNSSKKCYECHKNSLIPKINASYDVSYEHKDNANSSHYATLADLTNTSLDLNRCQDCHGVGAPGFLAPDYGNATMVPGNHSIMGGTFMECERACHNSAVDTGGYPVPVKLHSQYVGINVNVNTCYSIGCHTPPPTGGGGGGRR